LVRGGGNRTTSKKRSSPGPVTLSAADVVGGVETHPQRKGFRPDPRLFQGKGITSFWGGTVQVKTDGWEKRLHGGKLRRVRDQRIK